MSGKDDSCLQMSVQRYAFTAYGVSLVTRFYEKLRGKKSNYHLITNFSPLFLTFAQKMLQPDYMAAIYYSPLFNHRDMGFLKTLFGGKVDTPAEKQKKEEARDLDVLISDGIRAMRTRHADHAIKCFRHALEIKDDLQTRDYLAQALIMNEELKPAMEQLNILAEAQPDNIQIPITKARVAFLMEDYNAMVAACEQGLLIDKDNDELTLLYGRAARGQNDYTNAIAMFSKTILLNEDALDAYLYRGQAYLDQGDVEGAAADADRLMSLAGGNEDVLLLKAHVLRAQEKNEDALAVYGKMIDENPFCVTAYQERAELKQSMGDTKGADEDFEVVKEMVPPDEREDMEEKVRQAYRNNNPFGLG